MQAMILAAGRGTRLLPYTNQRPKPLFPLFDISLLDLTIVRLQQAGFTSIVVNAHHLAEQVMEALAGYDGVEVVVEERLLGTGGAIVNAFDHFDLNEPLLITNSDIYHTLDYRDFYREHCRRGCMLSLAIHNYPRFNSLKVEDGMIQGFRVKEANAAFTGIHLLAPSLLQNLEKGEPACIIEQYSRYLLGGGEVASYLMDDCYWRDLGTPADYLGLHGDIIAGRAPIVPELLPYIDNERILRVDCGEVEVEDWAYLAKGVLGGAYTLCRSVVWENGQPQTGYSYSDTIVMAEVVDAE